MSKQSKHFDIAKTGSLPAEHTSRPIIVGRDSAVRDPMTVDAADQAESPRLEKGRQKLNLKPLSSSIDKDVDTGESADKTSPTTPVEPAKVDDSITKPSIPPLPGKTPDSPVQKLIQDKTYHLPIHAHGALNKARLAFFIIFVVLIVCTVLYIIIV